MTGRCTTCGKYEHKRGALAAGCLVSDLTAHYVEGNATGPGLYVQLVAALGDPRRRDAGEPSARQKPGSRPPGWRSDVSALLADMRAHGFGHRSRGWLETHGIDELDEWKLQARRALGFVIPSTLLVDQMCTREVRLFVDGGWVTQEIGCRKTKVDDKTGRILGDSLRAAEDGATGVWCANPACHDDAAHPDCRLEFDDNGYPAHLDYGPVMFVEFSCRRTERSVRHALRWDAGDMAQTFLDEKTAEVLRQEQAELATMWRAVA